MNTRKHAASAWAPPGWSWFVDSDGHIELTKSEPANQNGLLHDLKYLSACVAACLASAVIVLLLHGACLHEIPALLGIHIY